MTSNDELKKILMDIQGDTKGLSSKLDKVQSELKVLTKENARLKKFVTWNSEKVSDLELKNKLLENKLNNCEMKLELFLNKDRMNNIILFKIPDSLTENENLTETVKTIFDKAEIVCDIDNIVSVKRIGNTVGSRPILITFNNKDIKADIFRKVKNFGNMNIGVSNDYSKVLREKRREQHNQLLECKLLLEDQGKTVQIRGHYIVMDNKSYDLDMTLKYLYVSQAEAPPLTDESSDEETDDPADSVISTASKKRGRKPGSKNVGGRKMKSLKLDSKSGGIDKFFSPSTSRNKKKRQ